MKTTRMKTISTIILLCICVFSFNLKAQTPNTTVNENDKIFPKGEPILAENFTGAAHLYRLIENDSIFTTVMTSVTFAPGSRTKWHSHPAGQVLLVTSGIGYTQERGKPIQVIKKGDIVKCLPNVDHWHGASPDSEMVHISLNPNTENGVVVWKEAVTDEEYKL